jgi:hypothetical protein
LLVGLIAVDAVLTQVIAPWMVNLLPSQPGGPGVRWICVGVLVLSVVAITVMAHVKNGREISDGGPAGAVAAISPDDLDIITGQLAFVRRMAELGVRLTELTGRPDGQEFGRVLARIEQPVFEVTVAGEKPDAATAVAVALRRSSDLNALFRFEVLAADQPSSVMVLVMVTGAQGHVPGRQARFVRSVAPALYGPIFLACVGTLVRGGDVPVTKVAAARTLRSLACVVTAIRQDAKGRLEEEDVEILRLRVEAFCVLQLGPRILARMFAELATDLEPLLDDVDAAACQWRTVIAEQDRERFLLSTDLHRLRNIRKALDDELPSLVESAMIALGEQVDKELSALATNAHRWSSRFSRGDYPKPWSSRSMRSTATRPIF